MAKKGYWVAHVDVDEAGQDQLAARVDLLAPLGRDRADHRDAPVRNRHVRLEPRTARPVDHRAAADDQIRSAAHVLLPLPCTHEA